MEVLPDELLLHVLTFLDPGDIRAIQVVSRRFLLLGRDNKLWKSLCFSQTRDESRRRREQLLASQDPALAAVRIAMTGLPQASSAPDTMARQPVGTRPGTGTGTTERLRALASWDPVYPSEQLNMYQEYVQRHAEISLDWFPPLSRIPSKSTQSLEYLGIGVLESQGIAEKLIAPVEDGTVCVFNISHDARHSSLKNTNFARSSESLLSSTQSRRPKQSSQVTTITETAAFEGVSIDSVKQHAFIAYNDYLHEIDLQTLQLVSRRHFPFAITCLSAARHDIPMTVGTTMTLHLHDSRISSSNYSNQGSLVRCELLSGPPIRHIDIFGRTSKSPATLTQPGPTSILHLPASFGSPNPGHEIWVGGRFTSLLNYDRRQWPKIQGTVFSGARLSSLAILPFPQIPRHLNLVQNTEASLDELQRAKADMGVTIIAGGEYKGKGSLELYGHDFSPTVHGVATSRPHVPYHNRQTAAKSRLLSIATHGGRIVFSDGDGNLKWTERDGSTEVRRFNINDKRHGLHGPIPAPSLFADPSGGENAGDIVQKILPVRGPGGGTIAQNALLVWTGEGRIGAINFDVNRKANQDEEPDFEDIATTRQREYDESIRRALEHQADEARYVRGLGLPWAG